MCLVSAVRQSEVPKKDDSRKQDKTYQTFELGTVFAPAPGLTGFRENKEQAMDWIKSCDKAELCMLKMITFFTICICWQFIGSPYWIHAFCMTTITVTKLFWFFYQHLKTPRLSTLG